MKTLVELKDYDLTPVSTFSYHMDLVIQTIKHEFQKVEQIKVCPYSTGTFLTALI